MEKIKKIFDLIDVEFKALVGILCKRVEVLEKENSLTPNLYKSLVKECLYEKSRNLKKLIEIYLTMEKVVFEARPKE